MCQLCPCINSRSYSSERHKRDQAAFFFRPAAAHVEICFVESVNGTPSMRVLARRLEANIQTHVAHVTVRSFIWQVPLRIGCIAGST
ncbi:hypothetical protein D3C76_981610 [compost metagenome]